MQAITPQIPSTTTTADITKRDLNVTATGHDKVYGWHNDCDVTFSTDKVSGDDVTAKRQRQLRQKNVGSNKPVTVTGISLSGADAGNYNLVSTTASTTANITARDLTVTASGDK